MAEAASGYSTLEFDLEAGSRGSRSSHLETLLTAVTGAEAGVVVNNNAAALYLVMSVYGAEREVIVSRGQAVEIGGGFRIPDVIQQSGARLVEVGTTNRTRATDYANAIGDDTAALLRVHPSNFRIVGFVEETPLSDMRKVADEARRRSRARPVTPYLVADESGRHDLKSGPMLIDDIGSGCLLDTRAYGLSDEPRPQDSLAAGADLVLFSGDKLLGGPQAGVIVGGQGQMEPLRRHPLMRALRPDKTAIAGLAATLEHYLAGEAEREVPVWRMIAADAEALCERAAAWQAAVNAGDVVQAQSPIGGGSLPGETRPTWVWSIESAHSTRLAQSLREWSPPVIARVADDRVALDPRTVLPDEDETVIAALREALEAL
jgi:L-seryl-tRNA(Ser) seleniumtransferase